MALATVAAAKITWKDALTSIGPVLLPTLMGAISALILTQYRVGRIEEQVSSGILPVARAEVEHLKQRVDYLEHRQDELMQFVISIHRTGSGYTYLPDLSESDGKKNGNGQKNGRRIFPH